MPATREPLPEMRLVIAQRDACDAHLLESKFLAPLLDQRCERSGIDRLCCGRRRLGVRRNCMRDFHGWFAVPDLIRGPVAASV